MASLATACRISARLARQRVVSETAFRGFRTATPCLAAQNFTMPALSPTMTEGNIASWKVKEGESFAAGDVLLEIETDKATMDVEAQEDGVLVKIMQGDGSKAVQVGSRIAVVAESGDDIATLEIPADEPQAASAPAPEPPAPAANDAVPAQKTSAPKPTGKTSQVIFPLLPSVSQLVSEKGLDKSTLSQITPTGPNGRLLKGDILAYLGAIKSETPSTISSRFEALSHLDLSNIKVAAKAPAPVQEAPVAEPEPQSLEISLPVSLSKVIEVQQKIKSTLGINLPITTFISRAAEIANEDLPPSRTAPTADELFDQILGLDSIPAQATPGFYLPQISALPEAQIVPPRPSPRSRDSTFDFLLGIPSKRASAVASQGPPSIPPNTNLFSLVVPPTEDKRASVFLERVKVILEKEPGRLVL